MSFNSGSRLSAQDLTVNRPLLAKEVEITRQPNHGWAPNPSMILLYGCLTTVTNACEALRLHESLNQPIYVLDQRNIPPLASALPMLETEPPSMPPLYPTR
jgi:hypothetical protein